MATEKELANALRKADAAGDVASARALANEIRRMRAAPPARDPAVTAKAMRDNPELFDPYYKEPKPSVLGAIGHAALGVPDTALTLVRGAVGTPIAGLAGLAAAPFTDDAAGVVEKTQNVLVGAPFSEAGRNTMGAISYPFEKLAQGADVAGGAVAKATGSPLLGAATNAGIQFAPALVGKVVPKGMRPGVRITPEETARSYVASNTGLDWNSLSTSVKAKITEIAKDAKQLEKLDPKALERQAQLESLPVPVKGTRGQLTQDPVQLRNEGNIAAAAGGEELRAAHVSQNRALLENIEVLKGKVRGTAETPEQVGMSVQDKALRNKLALKKQQVSQLYKKAEEAGELQGEVSPQGVIDLLDSSPDLTHLGWVDSWLNKVGARSSETTGGITVESIKNLTLKEMEDLRQAAVARAMDGGTEGFYAGRVIKAIDDATEGSGGAAYKAARKARREQAMEFEEQGAVDRLVSDKSRTDRATALEDTWRKTVIGGSLEDLNKVKRSLLTGGDTATRTAGRQAWRDMRAQTIDFIKEEATKGVQRFEDGTPNVTPAAMERAIRKVGYDKLESILGPGSVSELKAILEGTRILKTEPPASFKGSPTFANFLAFLNRKALAKVPFLGPVVEEAATKVQSRRGAARAGTSPIDEAAARGGTSGRRRAGRNAFMYGAGITTEMDQ